MPIGPKRLPFFEHIAELRKRILIIVAIVGVGASAFYYWSWDVFHFIMAPVLPHLPKGMNFFVQGMFDPFTFRFKVALYAALVVTSPITIWQALAFFLPALRPKEQRYFVPTFFTSAALFAAGVAFCYLVILDTAAAWMVSQIGGDVGMLPIASMWLSGVMLLLLGFGIAFEIPVVIFYLVLFNIVSYKKLRENWRTAYVVLMIVASVATPDWSPVTMGALFGALVLLYELSLLLARLLLVKRVARLKAEEAEDEV